jgi:hypothetical protein
MKRGTPGHWKILNLAMELKIEPYAAVGICCCMWEWVGASLMSGNIGKADDVMIARQIGWTKKPSVLIDALVKCGLLDRHPEHRLIVHDWSEHAEDGVHTWMVRRRLWFADGKAPRTRHLNSIERKEAEAYYGTATPPPQSKCGENVATPPESRSAKADGTERYGSVRDGSPHSPPKGDGDAKKHPRVIPAYTEASAGVRSLTDRYLELDLQRSGRIERAAARLSALRGTPSDSGHADDGAPDDEPDDTAARRSTGYPKFLAARARAALAA